MYRFVLGTEKIIYPSLLAGQNLSVTDEGDKVIVHGNGFEIPFDKETGLIVNATVGGEVIIEKGPFLNLYVNLNHLTGAEVRKTANHFATSDIDWKKKSFDYSQQKDEVCISLTGTYREVNVDFDIKVTSAGELSINYRTEGVPNGFLRETGLSFYLPHSIHQLNWRRKGYWNYYPVGAFAGNEGEASLYESQQKGYGEKPVQSWQVENKGCPPAQPPRWKDSDGQCTVGNQLRIGFIYGFYTECIVSGRYVGIRSDTVLSVIMPFFFISFEYISVRYPVLIIEIQCGKFNREHGLIVVQFDCFGVCDGFFQDRTFAETTQIAVGNFKVNNTCIVVRMQCFQFVGRECQDSLPGTNPQISIQGTEGTTLFQFHIQETVVFVVVTKLFGSLIETGQANFRCKPQVAVFIFYDGLD